MKHISDEAARIILDVLFDLLKEEAARQKPLSSAQVTAVGRALLPYLRNDLSAGELGMAAHDAAIALRKTGAA